MNPLAQVRKTILLFRAVFLWVRKKEEAQSGWDFLPEGVVLSVKSPLFHNAVVSFWEAILQVLGDYSGCQLAFRAQCASSVSLENERDLKFLISLIKWFLLPTAVVSLWFTVPGEEVGFVYQRANLHSATQLWTGIFSACSNSSCYFT